MLKPIKCITSVVTHANTMPNDVSVLLQIKLKGLIVDAHNQIR